MGAVCNTPADLSDIAQKDSQRLVGSVAKCLAANSPFINILEGGTFPSGVSDEVQTSVQMPAAPGDSLAIPTFSNDTDVCGTVGLQDKTDAINYTYRLGTKRGLGPRICVKKGYAAFKGSYLRAEDSLTKLITQYINADVKAQLLLKSGSKFVTARGYCFEDIFTGGEFTDVGVQFAQTLPDAPLTFKALHYLSRHLKEVQWAEMFPAGGKVQPHFRFIGSSDIIEAFRNETGTQNILQSFTEGGFKLGETALSAYSFDATPAYRGIAFGTDQTPLRATGFDGNGDLVLVNPRLTVADVAKNTAYSVTNPAWRDADYEVGFLVASMSFKRHVPQQYVGEGSFKFAPQLAMGELKWHYVEDNDCNIFGDFGSNALWSVPIANLTIGSVFPSSSYTVRTTQFAPNTGSINSVVAFGTDGDGNVYIVDIGGEVFILEPNP